MRPLSTLVALIALVGLVAVPRVHTQSPAPQGTWAEKARVEPRVEVASAVANGKLYVFGGLARGQDASTLNLGAIDGKIHVIGGRTNTRNDSVNRHDIYDVAKNTWTTGPPLPTTRSGGASVLYKGLIILAGGECAPAERTFANTEGYDVKTGQW